MKRAFRPSKSANLSDSVQQQLNKYALAAGAAGVGVLVLGHPAEAKIVYTPADTNITPDHTIPLDLNHDGIVDFGFRDVYRRSHPYGFDHTGVLSVIPANPANKIEGFHRTNGNYASALRAGVSIGPNAQFTTGANIMATTFIDTGRVRKSNSVCNGPWFSGANRYLGLEFLINGEVHFGWARLSVTCKDLRVLAKLIGYAYETVPNKPIIAGRTYALFFTLLALALASVGWSQAADGVLHSDGGLSSPRENFLTCSPAPCALAPVQASEGGNPVTDASIAASPQNPRSLLLGAQDTNCAEGLGFPMSAYATANGGSTWSPPSCMKPVYVYSTCCFPTVGYDRSGTRYIVGDYVDNGNLSLELIAFEKSINGSRWTDPAVAVTGSGFGSFDTPRLSIDTNSSSPFANSIYISATAYLSGTGNVAAQLAVAHSSDGGKTWTTTSVTQPQQSAELEFSNMAIGKNGTVYLTWLHCAASEGACLNGNSTASMAFSKSADGGSTWSAPKTMTTVTLAPCSCGPYSTLPNTQERISNFPVIGVDNSTGPNAGHLYVAIYNWTGTYMQVQVIRSKDGGTTWSKPVPVAPSTATHDQFFPWLSVSASGVVGVSWLDRRNDPANLSYQAFAAVSTDGGASFGTNWQLTAASSNPYNDGSGGTYMGDYTGNTWVGNTLYAAWMDTSNGISSQDVVGGLRLK
jgi:hypothetical protein